MLSFGQSSRWSTIVATLLLHTLFPQFSGDNDIPLRRFFRIKTLLAIDPPAFPSPANITGINIYTGFSQQTAPWLPDILQSYWLAGLLAILPWILPGDNLYAARIRDAALEMVPKTMVLVLKRMAQVYWRCQISTSLLLLDSGGPSSLLLEAGVAVVLAHCVAVIWTAAEEIKQVSQMARRIRNLERQRDACRRLRAKTVVLLSELDVARSRDYDTAMVDKATETSAEFSRLAASEVVGTVSDAAGQVAPTVAGDDNAATLSDAASGKAKQSRGKRNKDMKARRDAKYALDHAEEIEAANPDDYEEAARRTLLKQKRIVAEMRQSRSGEIL